MFHLVIQNVTENAIKFFDTNFFRQTSLTLQSSNSKLTFNINRKA